LKQLAVEDIDVQTTSTIIFTSGTANQPKAVLLSHVNVFAGLGTTGHRYVPYHLNDKG
jgi:long-subunit acyl-CoA synthetase (AMP-forming)